MLQHSGELTERRQQVMDLAKIYACADSNRLAVPVIIELGLRMGVDLRDPYRMAAFSVLTDCLRFGLDPSRSLSVLGCGEVAA